MIKIIWILFILNADSLKTPKDFIWKNRILIIQSIDSTPSWFNDNLKQELEDRKLLVLKFNGDRLERANSDEEIDTRKFLEKLKKSDLRTDQWVLIGLDGGLKNAGFNKPSPAEIFRIIDAMPMRQSEIRKSGK